MSSLVCRLSSVACGGVVDILVVIVIVVGGVVQSGSGGSGSGFDGSGKFAEQRTRGSDLVFDSGKEG